MDEPDVVVTTNPPPDEDTAPESPRSDPVDVPELDPEAETPGGTEP